MVNMPVTEVTCGETFGDIEMVFRKTRIMTAICVSDKATIYKLPKNVKLIYFAILFIDI